ncbi:MAG: helix-turn-helix domain-containing protein, partial [Anaerovoracaceae bacterium]
LETILPILLKQNIAALAIKDVYFQELPQSVINYANELHIPLFLFSDIYFDDIVFVIKSSLTPRDINLSALQKMRKILYETPTEVEIELLAKDINHYFQNNLISCFCMPKDRAQSNQIVAAFASRYSEKCILPNAPATASYSVLFFPQGISLTYTDRFGTETLREKALELIKSLEFTQDTFSIGISSPKDKLQDIGTAFKESVYAAVSGISDNIPVLDFEEIGIDRLLCPLRNDAWVQSYYSELIGKLEDYDRERDSDLLKTLITYIHNDCNINLTAEKIFQHSNTVRYRINKIKSILGISESPGALSQLFILVRLYEINTLFSGFRL